jgi:transcriptional regulator of acetoin/glycerol metabolism
VRSLVEVEKEMILKAILLHSGNIQKAAHALEISRNTLYRKMKEYLIGEAGSGIVAVELASGSR